MPKRHSNPAPDPVSPRANKGVDFLETWDGIYADVDKMLKSDAGLLPGSSRLESLEAIVAISVPAFCRRTCELGANISPTQRGISADIMVCQENNTDDEVLKVRVLESFPSYQLDRTISYLNGLWQPHMRTIHYGKPDDAALNSDVIAKALIGGHSVLEVVKAATSTRSELKGGVMSVFSLLPPSLFRGSALKHIRPGTVVSMSLVFLNRDFFGREWVDTTLEKSESLKKVLDLLYGLSLLRSSPRKKQNDHVAKLLERVGGRGRFSFTDVARACLLSKIGRGFPGDVC